MKKLVDFFEYLKRYHIDVLDTISIMLELFILKIQNPRAIQSLISKETKKEDIYQEFCNLIQTFIKPSFYVKINPNTNILKILKTIHQIPLNNEIIEQFLHTITQKKTSNKLYYYSTPLEVNQLLISLLEIKPGDEIYNPCYGIGSVFLSLANSTSDVKLYGEELDERLSNIAHLVAQVAKIKNIKLCVNDILKQPIFKTKDGFEHFDKVLCNPPLYAHMGIEYLKEDERFGKMGILVKNYPELVFLTHALSHLKKRGVFIVRNQTLQKSSLEEKLRERLCKEKMIEAIIELPKNIFPHQSHEFSILVISPENENILHINANNEYFYQKDGKYNRLIHIDEISNIFCKKLCTPYSTLTPLNEIQIHDLRAQTYLNKNNANINIHTLKSLGIEIFRGQRVYGSTKDKPITYYDVGIADFKPYGFTQDFENKKEYGDAIKIQRYALKSYDILLSLRGISPKITILGEINSLCVANAGIITLRAKNKKIAIGLYCYFFSSKGEKSLKKIYEQSGENTVNIENLYNLNIPKNYDKNHKDIFTKIQELSKDLEAIDKKIQQLKETE
ncbi:N-6 DNA methylase [Helicobacter cappadocius]|uniref:site-specific DNA-methyltransferase (adenine-specific) n=1 Tax=Helicobacter cappadocius TaxID=3063998 RepID=A0AA90PQD2_9HELI|nr:MULTISPECIES: N-6 DNA methylase [unclassified Helicobacter]MDO7252330.1 N-6 DNA methylase [Helicobacter sp. faydin-H75]MDP2538197.1 N-6 DNA methylase [Helicobacter sp. faydin-H76]